jgi:hypothetical protein
MSWAIRFAPTDGIRDPAESGTGCIGEMIELESCMHSQLEDRRSPWPTRFRARDSEARAASPDNAGVARVDNGRASRSSRRGSGGGTHPTAWPRSPWAIRLPSSRPPRRRAAAGVARSLSGWPVLVGAHCCDEWKMCACELANYLAAAELAIDASELPAPAGAGRPGGARPDRS